MLKRILFSGSMILLASAANVQAAPLADDRWLPWLGCWRAADAPATNVLCIVPEGEGVRIAEYADGKMVRESRVVANGQSRAVNQEGCTGTEQARWSSDGERVYVTTDMTCGERTRRQATGIFGFVTGSEWVSVQAISASGLEPGSRTVRYTPTDAHNPPEIAALLRENRLARETSRYALAKPLDLDDVREATRAVHARAVEALIIAHNQPFKLNGKTLVGLAKAGVPESVIDVLVAVSNPSRFALTSPDAEPGEISTATRARSGYSSRFCDDWDDYYDPTCSSRYGYYRYSPFGYGYGFYSPYGYNSYGWRYGSTPVIIIRGDEGSEPVTRGRATRQGYSSGKSSSTPSMSKGSTGSSSGSSTGGSSSSGGSSSGSSTGRTAKARGSGSN
jgi:uncharacterized membrane protein YgcG